MDELMNGLHGTVDLDFCADVLDVVDDLRRQALRRLHGRDAEAGALRNPITGSRRSLAGAAKVEPHRIS